jgi:para-aminobenzoate synthetase component 1
MKYRFEQTIHRASGFPLAALAALCAEEEYFAMYVTSATRYTCAIGAYDRITLHNAEGAFEKVEAFQRHASYRIAGYLGYDLKNDLEQLASANEDALDMPVAAFFDPLVWMEIDGNTATLAGADQDAMDLFAERLHTHLEKHRNTAKQTPAASIILSPRTDRATYLDAAYKLKAHIQRGDIYEVNYCIQFAGKAPKFDPVTAFLALQERTEAPMSVFARMGPYHILCASPERFLKKTGDGLLSQPIKGTARRSDDPKIDEALKEALRNDPKERSENVMIVDLVRNDLSRVAARDSVKVDELFGIYTFKTVHHMVSSISARLTSTYPWNAVRACFPMGSMTGAPKISAMQLIDSHENFKRGAYSGAFGWMDAPRSCVNDAADFDFNVMIRTLLYNSDKELATLSVGSALTSAADPEKEYDECLLKARVLMEVLNPSLANHGVEAAL